jgi:LysM repeat protein
MSRKSVRRNPVWRVVAAGLLISLIVGLVPPGRVGALASDVQGSAAQQSLNLLENPSFEGDFEIQCSFPGGKPWIAVPCDGVLPARPWQTVQMAKGWSGWWQPPNENRQAKDFYDKFPNYCGQLAPDDCVAWHMPEFRDTRSMPQDPPRIRSGENSQKYFTFWSVHEGGVYQVVEGLRPGTPLRFSIYLQAWSATKLNGVEPNPHFSFGQTSMHMKVGIDPTGGTDPWSKDIVWSAEKDTFDKFERYDVQAVARANKVTVFTHSRPENPMEHNDVYLDDAELSFIGGASPSGLVVNPPPAMVAVEGKPATANGGRISHIVKPGDTLFALALQYGVPVDQIMALNGLKPDSRIEIGRELIIALPLPPAQPEAPAAPTGNPFPGTVVAVGAGRGAVCVQAFVDEDANGLWLASEAPLAAVGLHVAVLNPQGETVAERTLAEVASETCFADLPASTYRVVADPPPGFNPTWQRRWSVSLPGGAIVTMPFGVQAAPIESSWPIGVAIVAALGLLAVGVVSGVVVWRRRRRQAWQ